MTKIPAWSISNYYDLGTYGRHVSASTDEARLWFNRGLIWCYGFNHEEAVRCFERAISCGHCAMAYWGIAYAIGPNYNKPWDFFDEDEVRTVGRRAVRLVQQAKSVADHEATLPVEKALIRALQFRYADGHPSGSTDWASWNEDYANAMEKVQREFPDDLDVATLCADAQMNLTPWRMWDMKTGEPADGARTESTLKILERAMTLPGGNQHPGILHLYIHLMEMSSTPEAALTAADALRGLVPDAGHLRHMPSHIDILLGDYTRGVKANQKAIAADEKYLAREGPLNFYTLYRMHDYHFCLYSALFAGQSRIALRTVAQIEDTLKEELLRVRSPPMADWLEGFLAMRVHVLIRFGRWQDCIDLRLPQDQKLYCVTTAMTHYAKAVAYAAKGDLTRADQERETFSEARKVVPTSRVLFNNRCVDILQVAESMMYGELEYRRGNYDVAFAHLRESIARDDALPYDEPWGWMQPTRHAYGALLMEQGHFKEASVVYAEDLGLVDKLPRCLRHPNNVWALHGYHECMVKLGRTKEAAEIEPQLKRALANADVPIKASCYCRLTVSAKI